MRPQLILLLLPLLVLGPVSALSADEETRHPRIFVHVKAVEEGTRINCFSHGLETPADAVTRAPAPAEGEEPLEYLVWILVTGYDTEVGLAGMQWGIAYDGVEGSGVDIDDWWTCAQLEWHQDDWPLPGTGNLITWASNTHCQKDPFTCVGFFRMTVHSSDRFTIIPRPVDDVAAIAECTSYAYSMERWDLGIIGFGEETGYNPLDEEARPARRAEIEADRSGDSGR